MTSVLVPAPRAGTETVASPAPLGHGGIISLSGFARSGKDTVAATLVDLCDYTRVSFADAIRDALYTLDPVISDPGRPWQHRLSTMVDSIGWDGVKTQFPEARRLLQVFGTEVGRDTFGDSVWLDKVMDKIRSGGQYVVTDTRFHNEYDLLKASGACMVWISRPGVRPVNSHLSDDALVGIPFDVYIDNDGTLEDLRCKALALA